MKNWSPDGGNFQTEWKQPWARKLLKKLRFLRQYYKIWLVAILSHLRWVPTEGLDTVKITGLLFVRRVNECVTQLDCWLFTFMKTTSWVKGQRFVTQVHESINCSSGDANMLILHHPECTNFIECSGDSQTHRIIRAVWIEIDLKDYSVSFCVWQQD